MAIDLQQQIRLNMEKARNEKIQKVEAAAHRAHKRLVDQELERVQSISHVAADHFYKNYPPKFYFSGHGPGGRRGTLYHVLRIRRFGDTSYQIDFDPSVMTYRNGGGGGEHDLYQTVFKEGWHGGAKSGDGHPDAGTPYWRYPYPVYKMWGRKAARAEESPYQEIVREYNSRTAAQVQEDLERLFHEELRHI